MMYGYYIFLGGGDYHLPKDPNCNWTCNWNINHWKKFLIQIKKLNADTLMVYLNGHSLPYKSKLFPELIQSNHPNVQKEFFSEIIKFAASLEIKIIAVFTTTGHSGNYLKAHPELGIKVRSKELDLQKLLVPFPEHIRKTKHQAQAGNAQVGYGILCHNNPAAQDYAKKLIKDGLDIYPQVDGVALHPPESIYACFCNTCCDLFNIRFNKDLLLVSDEEARKFYLETYLDFQLSLNNEIKKYFFKDLFSFTVPWLFEPCFDAFAYKIPKDVTLIDWDYNLDVGRISTVENRLRGYREKGHELLFMPTAGFGITIENIQEQLNYLQVQMEAALRADIKGIIHFIGPHLVLDLNKTFFVNRLNRKKSGPQPNF